MAKENDDKFSKEETQKRFEAALRGARVAGHKPKGSVTPKRKDAQQKKVKKKK